MRYLYIFKWIFSNDLKTPNNDFSRYKTRRINTITVQAFNFCDVVCIEHFLKRDNVPLIKNKKENQNLACERSSKAAMMAASP